MSKGNPCKCNFEAESLDLISLNIFTLLIMKLLLLLIYIKIYYLILNIISVFILLDYVIYIDIDVSSNEAVIVTSPSLQSERGYMCHCVPIF